MLTVHEIPFRLDVRVLHQGKNLTSERHEHAIRRATPKALLSSEEQAKAIEEMGAKGKGKTDCKGSKEIDKTASKVIFIPPPQWVSDGCDHTRAQSTRTHTTPKFEAILFNDR